MWGKQHSAFYNRHVYKGFKIVLKSKRVGPGDRVIRKKL